MTPLERLIQQRGLKKTWIAEQAGITRGTFTRILSGKGEPSLRVALRIARVLNVTVEDLWGYLIE